MNAAEHMRLRGLLLKAEWRWERRHAACSWARADCRRYHHRGPWLSYRISINQLRRAGFWHHNPRHPQGTRRLPWGFWRRGPTLYYEDLLLYEDEALAVWTHLSRLAGAPRGA